MSTEPYVALTDKAWFDFLASRAVGAPLDEVNFWSPSSVLPLKHMRPGEPVFFRLHAPISAIAGYGFFAHFAKLSLTDAWQMFGEKNGDPDEVRFRTRIGGYRHLDLLDARSPNEPLGCTILRDATFWPPTRWLRWGAESGWKPNIVRGRTERDPARASRLLAEIQYDTVPEEFAPEFELQDVDDRTVVLARTVKRVGQGAFRSRLLEAYEGRCAITGEHTEPVLDAAHIQPYLGPGSNHIRNGLLMCKEFHTLFDRGFVTITPDLHVRVSERLRSEWGNGHRYYAYRDSDLVQVPKDPSLRPSAAALEWHSTHLYLG